MSFSCPDGAVAGGGAGNSLHPLDHHHAPATQAAAGVTDPVRITDVDLGPGLASDKRVTDKTDSFKPSEAVYVSVRTTGAAPECHPQGALDVPQDGQAVQ